ncbi:Fur family transcriptional regulator [Actinokineospora iranica]|uniref:Fur family transcriptional regulator, ferric uptake regulator n=1 Tax=Actinokineospora iranica TaxID=1271860 RepID=A0A1G6UG28_9PSEU|nr:transcriptional repressor [Actinokineospora iranica]SDD39515.1 Fur family transcriptional regulator, ferric uptake regulator [Actinokineospora iranica]
MPTDPPPLTDHDTHVLRALTATTRFLTVVRLHEILLTQGHHMPLRSVYRCLNRLIRADLVDRMPTRAGTAVYRRRADRRDRHHLVCANCGHTAEIADDDIAAWVSDAARAHGFTDATTGVTLSGTCASCAATYRDDEA